MPQTCCSAAGHFQVSRCRGLAQEGNGDHAHGGKLRGSLIPDLERFVSELLYERRDLLPCITGQRLATKEIEQSGAVRRQSDVLQLLFIAAEGTPLDCAG